MRTIPINAAETNISALLAAAEGGEEIALTRHGRVVVRMLPGTRSAAAPRLRSEEARIAFEAPLGIMTELISPLD